MFFNAESRNKFLKGQKSEFFPLRKSIFLRKPIHFWNPDYKSYGRNFRTDHSFPGVTEICSFLENYLPLNQTLCFNHSTNFPNTRILFWSLPNRMFSSTLNRHSNFYRYSFPYRFCNFSLVFKPTLYYN